MAVVYSLLEPLRALRRSAAVSVLCCIIGFGATARADDGYDEGERSYYALTAGYGLRSGPVFLRTESNDEGTKYKSWHHEPAYSFRIQENWKGPIYYMNKLWFAIATMTKGKDASGNYYIDAYEADGIGGAWGFDIGSNYLRFALEGRLLAKGASFLDLRLGLWLFPAFDLDEHVGNLDPTGPSAKLLMKEGAETIDEAGGVDFFMMHIRLALREWRTGSLHVGSEFSIINLFLFPAMPFKDDGFTAFVWRWGVPRTSIGVEQRLGPIVLGAKAQVPNALLVVPFYMQAFEVMGWAGLRI